MRCGLFGKLPAKRDFVAFQAPRPFLEVWERWLQGGVSASHAALGPGWQAQFLRAPIWRFWLGGAVAGAPVLGAFMPSVDGVGRYFPLSVFAAAEGTDELPPPELAPQEAWFAAAEEVLLGALAAEASYEAVAAAVGRLPAPLQVAAPDGALRLAGGAVLLDEAADRLDRAFVSARRADHSRLYGGATYWWTIGGEDFQPAALIDHGMPDPYLFAALMSGRFADAPAAGAA